MDPESHFSILVAAACVDGCIQEEERTLLRDCAERLGIDTPAANRILARVLQNRTVPLPEMLEHEKEELFRSLLEVVLADGLIYGNERSYVERVGRHLGYLRVTIAMIYQSVVEELAIVPRSPGRDSAVDSESSEEDEPRSGQGC